MTKVQGDRHGLREPWSGGSLKRTYFGKKKDYEEKNDFIGDKGSENTEGVVSKRGSESNTPQSSEKEERGKKKKKKPSSCPHIKSELEWE